MTNCNNIKRLIDETEQPEALPFEATHHVNACAPCRRFADERASLRGLLNGMPRVNAPMNFDAQLKARITTAKAKPAFAWSSPALYLRFGAASAALLVAVFVAQYNGLFSSPNHQANSSDKPAQTQANNFAQTPIPAPKEDDTTVEPKQRPPLAPLQVAIVNPVPPNKGNRRTQPGVVQLEGESMPDRVPGLIVRRSGREVELPMLPVSLGAQQQLINRSSRSAVQPIAISF
jgi:hypothetical protein